MQANLADQWTCSASIARVQVYCLLRHQIHSLNMDTDSFHGEGSDWLHAGKRRPYNSCAYTAHEVAKRH